jgi:hypothetical protein
MVCKGVGVGEMLGTGGRMAMLVTGICFIFFSNYNTFDLL